jgi:ribosomal-protein-alanine N-acetyltransferase
VSAEAPEPVTVRPMRGSDIEPVSKIERQSFTTAWNAQAYVTELSNPNALYLVVTLGDRDTETERVIGYGGLWVIMDEAHVTTIAIIPEFRGRKIGDRLLCAMLQAAMVKGATRATLEVRESNLPARRLYEKYGFAWVAVRKKYYADTNENADILWIDDMTTPDWSRLFADNRAALGVR